MSFGGRNTKVHTMGDTLSNSVVSMLSYDNDHDALHTVFFLRQTEIEGNSVISDKAYGSQALRGARMPFPPTARRKPWSADNHVPKGQHLAKCPFRKINSAEFLPAMTNVTLRSLPLFSLPPSLFCRRSTDYLVFKQSLVSFDIFNFINIGFAHAKENQSRARRSTLRVTSEKNSFLLFMEKSPFSWWCFLA